VEKRFWIGTHERGEMIWPKRGMIYIYCGYFESRVEDSVPDVVVEATKLEALPLTSPTNEPRQGLHMSDFISHKKTGRRIGERLRLG
jgi:hypothetical protein